MLYAFLFALFRHLPRCTPPPLRSASPAAPPHPASKSATQPLCFCNGPRPPPPTAVRCAQSLRVLNVVNALAAVLMLVLLGQAVSTSHKFVEVHKWKEEAWALAHEAMDEADNMTDLARQFVQFGDPLSYYAFWDLLHSGVREHTVEAQRC